MPEYNQKKKKKIIISADSTRKVIQTVASYTHGSHGHE
jgi:hypothetical protein